MYKKEDMEGAVLRKCKQVKVKKIDKIRINKSEERLKEKIKSRVHKAFMEEKMREERNNVWNGFYKKHYSFFDTDDNKRNDSLRDIIDNIEERFYRESYRQQKRNQYYQHQHQQGRSFLNYGQKTEREYGLILGLQGRVQKSKIRDYWRKELLHWHPDKWINGNKEERKKAHEKTILINEAYKFFKNKYNL